jgi:isopenicillin N synthase-like dioxygenase
VTQGPSAIQPVSMSRFESDFEGFSRDLGDSFVRYGFAVVADHGLDQAVIDRALADAKAFFAQDADTKKQWHEPGTGGARGYTPFGTEAAKDADVVDLKEFWHTGRELPQGHPYRGFMRDNVRPDTPAGFHDSAYGLFTALDAMGARLLTAIARYLGLPDDWFADKVEMGNSVLRLLHYPPIPADAPGVRAGAHEDINVITLLLGAEEGGLQVKDRRNGEWLPINPPAGALVVNVGDMLQRLTNHVLPSTSHRVVNPPPERRGVARYSTPFFLHFNPDFLIETLPSTVTPDNPDRYPEPITSQDYLMQRLREIRLL